jgi:hypothetical protein
MSPSRAGALALAVLCAACAPPPASSPSQGVPAHPRQDVLGRIPVQLPGPPRSSKPTGRIIMRPFSSAPSALRPLVMVDGRIRKESGDLDPADIAKIHVLRAPAAVKRYGPRAANGAVLVTTKRGRDDAPGR